MNINYQEMSDFFNQHR